MEGKKQIERPISATPEYQLWQVRREQGTGIEKGVQDPHGTFYPLQEGESFEVRLQRDKGTYEAVAVDKKTGVERQLGLGKIAGNAEKETKVKLDINKKQLNDLITRCEEPGALFGRDVTLTIEEKEDVRKIVNAIENYVTQATTNNRDWNTFEKTLQQALAKGFLSVGSWKFPPSWLVNGGNNSRIEEISTEIEKGDGKYTTGQIVVPDRIYNLYFWKEKARMLKDTLSLGSGASAKHLATELRDAAHFLKQIGSL